MTRFYINPTEIDIIKKVIEENNVKWAFELIHESGSGIGSTLDIEFDSVLNGREVKVRVPITTEENW